MTDKTNIIDSCRQEISEIDGQIFELVKRRELASALIGKAKLELNIPVRDFAREKLVFEQAIKKAEELDLPKNLMINLQEHIIKISLARQEKDRIKANTQKNGQSVVIIGGAGRLGTWIARFFADLGHEIRVVDLIKPDYECVFQNKLEKSVTNSDVIVVATPIRTTREVLKNLLGFDLKRPTIFDVASVKNPIKNELYALRDAQANISSLHPMFGPSVELLFGKHMIRCSLGHNRADQAIDSLFASTSLEIVDMSIDDHDELISYLLSLSHLINLIFISVLKESGFPLQKLEKFSSPTFSNILHVAKRVISENPKLYYEIQHLNPKNEKVYDALEKATQAFLQAIEANSDEQFGNLMNEGRAYVEG